MNRYEIGKKITDALFGKKVHGEVAALLPEANVSRRFIINTGEEFVEVALPKVSTPISIVPLPPLEDRQLRRGDIFDGRVREAKPWANGQTI